MTASKFKKGDLVIVDEDGQPTIYEIASSLIATKRSRSNAEVCYNAKQVQTGKMRTLFEDEILRPATPIDNAAQLFRDEK